MRHSSIADARASFSAVIGAVRYGGDTVVLTSHGKPVAAIVSIADFDLIVGKTKRAPTKSPRKTT